MSSVNTSYTTPNGDYYVGMTKQEAEKKGLYKKIVDISLDY